MNMFFNSEAQIREYQPPAGCSPWIREAYKLGSTIKIKEMNEICGDLKLNFDEYIYESVQRFPFSNINKYKKSLIKTNFQIGNEYLKSAIFNEIFKALK